MRKLTDKTRTVRIEWDVGKEAINCQPTSADGPVVAPSHVAVGHPQAADALRALQLVALVAGEVNSGPPSAGGGVCINTGAMSQTSRST